MKTLTALAAAALLTAPLTAQATPSAQYTVTFQASWSAASHPDQFPPGPHFSGLVGATHDSSVDLWEPGQPASEGMERMAELGSKTVLLDEVAAFGAAAAPLSGGAVFVSPGDVSLSFSIDQDRPLVSLVTMVAPSPDWFVGVDGLSLFEGGDWRPCLTVDLFGWDAGTDSGVSYTSANSDTQPPGPIAPLTAPVTPGVPLGRFVFVRSDMPPSEPWVDLGQGLDLAGGTPPVLDAAGTLCGGSPLTVTYAGGLPAAPAFLCVGVAELNLPFHGGVLVPDISLPPGTFVPLATDGAGGLVIPAEWPLGLPGGVPLLLQVWQPDPAAPLGFQASNALRGETP